MEFENLTAQVRAGRKKGVARRLRRDGYIPAVCYGQGMSPLALSVDPKVLTDALCGSLGRNVVIQLNVEGEGSPSEPLLVMLQDYQYHPVSREILHADFLKVAMDQEVHVQVPFKATGRAAGVQTGGVLAQVYRSLPIKCRPDEIPPVLEIDVTEMGLGSIRKVSDLVLPPGIVVEYEQHQTLVSVSMPAAIPAETEEEEEEEEVAEVAEEAE